MTGTTTPLAGPNAARRLARVLVAEDDPDILAVVTLALGRVGNLAVTGCATGLEVLERVAGAAPDLIVLDVMMPDLDGLQTLVRLRADSGTAHIPVVFMTARLQPRDIEAYQALGAQGVIAKPFDPMTLAQQLRDLHAASIRASR